MSVLKILRERVAPELNHLYVDPPSEGAAGFDAGWHGREHALHTYFVALLFGAEAGLCQGDFAIISQFLPPITSMEREPKHGWCVVNGVAPVDLSLTFQHFNQAPQLRNPLVGEGRNGDWQVHYAEDETALDEGIQDQNEILFIEKETATAAATELIDNPYLYLPPPNAQEIDRWQMVYGGGICAKISLHCYRCANGEAKSVRQKLNREEAVKWIHEQYADAEETLRTKLG